MGNMGSCQPCECNGNEQNCYLEENKIKCVCKPGYQGDKCEFGGGGGGKYRVYHS